MKFLPLDKAITESYQSIDRLKADCKGARQIGLISLGEICLYVRKPLKTYYISYSDIKRAYRRVLLVPAKMCCASGDLPVESLVLHSETGEIANVTLPGTKAAQILIEEIKKKAPMADFTCPEKPKEPKQPGKSEKSQQAHKSKNKSTEV